MRREQKTMFPIHHFPSSIPHSPMQNKPKIILDTDPGGDDIFALLWILSLVKQGLAELVGVTTAQGNVNADVTFACASQVLSLIGYEQITLAHGVINTTTEISDAAYIHGADGMGGLSRTLPPVKHDYKTAPYSDDLIIEKLNSHPGEITLIAIAPLTNLAAAEIKCPGILKKAKEIVIMGGAFHVPGNVSPYAEFNIGFDVAAAQKVFASRNDIVVLPLDITSQLIFTPEMANNLYKNGKIIEISNFILNLSKFLINASLIYRQTEGIEGFLVHDAAAVAYLFYPETLWMRRTQVEIETNGVFTKGKTVIDNRHIPKLAANAWVALQVDSKNLLASLVEDLKCLIQLSF